jgi:hypothetical protein
MRTQDEYADDIQVNSKKSSKEKFECNIYLKKVGTLF